ncbi:uncharacterized protein OCT59_005053 [Rhizophagus irregularis]|uniref:uncharacterized protein n=1 Tax=Rhizophagus irregularis TaxID=588596 RepID=UPI0033342525|nr:hypothetical protein OCT59_005053 [Rhizophagus irregularis]
MVLYRERLADQVDRYYEIFTELHAYQEFFRQSSSSSSSSSGVRLFSSNWRFPFIWVHVSKSYFSDTNPNQRRACSTATCPAKVVYFSERFISDIENFARCMKRTIPLDIFECRFEEYVE